MYIGTVYLLLTARAVDPDPDPHSFSLPDPGGENLREKTQKKCKENGRKL